MQNRKDEIEKVKHFYGDLLGLPILRSWGEPELEGFMFETGDGLVEVFTNAEEELPQGSIRHFAFKTNDVDQCVKIVRESGYQITLESKDVVIASNPPFPIRVAFGIGPVGEERPWPRCGHGGFLPAAAPRSPAYSRRCRR